MGMGYLLDIQYDQRFFDFYDYILSIKLYLY